MCRSFEVTIPDDPALCDTVIVDRVDIAILDTQGLDSDAFVEHTLTVVCGPPEVFSFGAVEPDVSLMPVHRDHLPGPARPRRPAGHAELLRRQQHVHREPAAYVPVGRDGPGHLPRRRGGRGRERRRLAGLDAQRGRPVGDRPHRRHLAGRVEPGVRGQPHGDGVRRCTRPRRRRARARENPPGENPPGELPATGRETGTLLLLASLALAVGAGLLVTVRRRRAHE